MKKQYTEKIYNEDGKLLYTEPYIFRSLFKVGQMMRFDSKDMEVLSCEKKGDEIITKVRIHKNKLM